MSGPEDARMRKLQPIYSALDGQEFQQVIRLCERKDVEKWSITKALKANAFARLGRADLAMDLCREVQSTAPTDEGTLLALCSAFRACQALEELTTLYENAVKRQPANVQFLNELFSCYLRRKDYQRAQQTATKLYKLDNLKGKYILWAAVGMLIQTKHGGPKHMLTLAEKLVHKALSEKVSKGLRPTGEELTLYITLLKEQGKYKEALEGVSLFANLGEDQEQGAAPNTSVEDESSLEDGTIVTMQHSERRELGASLMEQLEDYKGAMEVYSQLLHQMPDQWAYYLRHMDLGDLAAAKAKDNSEGGEGKGAEAAWGILAEIQKMALNLQAAKPKFRGPYLAEMELLRRITDRFGADVQLPAQWRLKEFAWEKDGQSTANGAKSSDRTAREEMMRLLTAYFQLVVGDKHCAFADIETYLKLFLPSEDPTQEQCNKRLIAFFQRQAEDTRLDPSAPVRGPTDGVPAEERDAGILKLARYICANQVARYLGAHRPATVTDDQLRGIAREYAHQYRATLYLSVGAEGGGRDLQHGDDLVLLAVHSLRDLWRRAEGSQGLTDQGYLLRLEAACLLEMGIQHSEHNHQFKILATQLYTELGSFDRGFSLFELLDTKNIQVQQPLYVDFEQDGTSLWELDSLSWPVYPGCVECGWFMEAHIRSRAVINMHRNCQRETADYMCKAFSQGNFSKAVEIAGFQEDKLDRSLQLAAAKSEKAALEMLLTHHPLPNAIQYLQELGMGMQDAALLTDAELDNLSNNFDYSVNPSWDCPLDTVDEEEHKRRSTQKLVPLIKARMVCNKALITVFQGEKIKAVNEPHLNRLATHLEQNMGYTGMTLAEEPVADVAAKVGDIALEDKQKPTEATNGHAVEDPHEAGVRLVAQNGWRTVVDSLRALAAANQAFDNGPNLVEPAALKISVAALERCIIHMNETLQAFREHIPQHICAVDGQPEQDAPVDPRWLSATCKWMLNACSALSLTIQGLGQTIPAPKKKKLKGKAKKGTAPVQDDKKTPDASVVKAQEALAAFGTSVLDLLKIFTVVLKSNINVKGDRSNKTRGGVLPALLKGDLGTKYTPTLDFLAEPDGETSLRQTCSIVEIGQVKSCDRVLELVKEKFTILHNNLTGSNLVQGK